MAKSKEPKDTKDTKEIAVKEKPEKPAKVKKQPKTVTQKKLPKMFRKKYSEKAYKKLLKKIFIDADKKLVVSVLEKQQDKKGRTIYLADKNKDIVKANAGRLKVVAKQIKKQKKGIRLVPLLAVAIVIAGIGITVTMFKNVIVKKAIVSAMQGIFQAKTDIAKVDVQIFGASIEVVGLQQANKDSPMKNIFQIDDITLDFNLNDLLKGKLHVEKVGVEGVALGTDRKTSGELPVKTKKQKEENKIVKTILNEKDELVGSAKKEMLALFESYNPENMLAELKNDLKSPALAQNIYNEVNAKVEKWKEEPAKLEQSVNEFSASVQTVMNTDWSKVQDVNKIKEAVETVKSAIDQGQKLSDTIKKTADDVKADSMLVVDYTHEIQDSILADKNLIENKVNDVKRLFSIDGLTDIMTDAVKSIIYDYTAKFGPYVNQVVDFAMTTAENSIKTSINKTPEQKQAEKAAKAEKKAAKAEKKAKKDAVKKSRERAKGRDIYYRKDRVPKFLIEEAVASGYEFGTDQLLFKGVAKNITSNQDTIEKNTTVEASFKVLGNPNDASVIIDARSNTTAPLVLANYNGRGYDISANAEVFALESKSDITAMLSADRKGNFSVGGILDMNVTNMTGMQFEPEMVCRIYNNALSEIKNLTIGFGIDYSLNGKLSVELKNLDKLVMQLVNPISKALMGELTVIAENAKNEAIKMLSEKTGIATDKIAQFTNISDAMNAVQSKSDGLQAQLEAKKKELSDLVTNYAKNAASDALKDVIPNAPSIPSVPSGGSKEDAKDAAKGALKGLLGR